MCVYIYIYMLYTYVYISLSLYIYIYNNESHCPQGALPAREAEGQVLPAGGRALSILNIYIYIYIHIIDT